jgi:hypothetical protein
MDQLIKKLKKALRAEFAVLVEKDGKFCSDDGDDDDDESEQPKTEREKEYVRILTDAIMGTRQYLSNLADISPDVQNPERTAEERRQAHIAYRLSVLLFVHAHVIVEMCTDDKHKLLNIEEVKALLAVVKNRMSHAIAKVIQEERESGYHIILARGCGPRPTATPKTPDGEEG